MPEILGARWAILRISEPRGEKPMRAGLYARVSPHDQQTLPLQRDALRAYVRQRGWSVARQIEDVGSGAAQRRLREELMELACCAGWT